jgi:K+-sensing histidine kinase KdpD
VRGRSPTLLTRRRPDRGPGALDHALRALIIGILAATVGLLIRVPLRSVLGDSLPFITFFPAVAVAAWAGGLRGGLVATVASAAIAASGLMTAFDPGGAPDRVELGLFVIAGVLISSLGGQLHEAIDGAERSRDRAAFLAEASALVDRRLDRLAAIESLAAAVVPRFADLCAVDLIEPGGEFGAVRIAHEDPDLLRRAYDIRTAHPPRTSDAAGVGAVARTGAPAIALRLSRDLERRVSDPEMRAAVDQLGLRSVIAVPLAAPDGTILGVMSLAMAESGRIFEAGDIETALDLGRRAGVALDHAILFAAVQTRRDELDAVMRSIADPVLVTDATGVIRSQNPAATTLLGLCHGRPLDDVLASLEPVDGEPDTRAVPGMAAFVVPHVLGVEAAGDRSRIAILRDVTPVLESEAARDAFVGMLSHELRTPITSIYGSARILRRPLEEGVRASLVDDLVEESDRLFRLVEDLLVLSRFERGRLDIAPEPVLVQRVAARILDREAGRNPGLHLTMDAEEDLPPVLGDATYLEQVLRNLVGNAVKYAGDTASLIIRVRRQDRSVLVDVEDDGPGIPDADQERVFALYERLHTRATAPGAGIGLFVCRRLVEAMGGTIGVRRGLAGGACFTVTLPMLGSVEPSEPSGPLDVTAV